MSWWVLAIIDGGRSVGQFWPNLGRFQSNPLRFGRRGSAAVGSDVVLGLINTRDTPTIGGGVNWPWPS
jgi:hypothetical protein